MQQKTFLAILGISIVVTAASLGYSASRFLSAKNVVLPPPAASRGATAESAGGQSLPPEKWTNLFAPDQGMDIPSRLTGKAKAQEKPATAYVLLGTIASDSRTARRAILWADGMKNPRIDREQTEVEPGVRLSRIERDYVILSRGKEQQRLDILPVGSKSRISVSPAAPTASTGPPRGTSEVPAGGEIKVTRLGENSFSLDETTASQLTGNINQYMTNVRMVPYFEGNKSAGYRIAAVRPGSAFEQLGFKGGDVIQQINNVELTTPDKMYTIFQNLKDEKRVTVNILRMGQKSTITYEIR